MTLTISTFTSITRRHSSSLFPPAPPPRPSLSRPVPAGMFCYFPLQALTRSCGNGTLVERRGVVMGPKGRRGRLKRKLFMQRCQRLHICMVVMLAFTPIVFHEVPRTSSRSDVGIVLELLRVVSNSVASGEDAALFCSSLRWNHRDEW